jgi:hypothetical protein
LRDASLFNFSLHAALRRKIPRLQVLNELFYGADFYCTLLRELIGKSQHDFGNGNGIDAMRPSQELLVFEASEPMGGLFPVAAVLFWNPVKLASPSCGRS